MPIPRGIAAVPCGIGMIPAGCATFPPGRIAVLGGKGGEIACRPRDVALRLVDSYMTNRGSRLECVCVCLGERNRTCQFRH